MLRPENVQDYPRPPLVEPVTEPLRAVLGDREVLRTTRAWRVCETHHAPTYYIPPDDIAEGLLTPNSRTSFCEWKGRAAYFDLRTLAGPIAHAAWCYPDPTPRFAAIRDMVAIYAWALDAAFVDDVAVIPQPGDFYGGWVTPNLQGIVKGGPGTEGW